MREELPGRFMDKVTLIDGHGIALAGQFNPPIFDLFDLKESRPPQEETVEDLQEDLGEKPRVEMPVRPPKKRIGGFEEIEMGFSEAQARQEARRCLRCDLEK